MGYRAIKNKGRKRLCRRGKKSTKAPIEADEEDLGEKGGDISHFKEPCYLPKPATCGMTKESRAAER